MSKELWRPIEGFDGLYEISSHGRVKSLGRVSSRISRLGNMATTSFPAKILKPGLSGSGYHQLVLRTKGKQDSRHQIHRIVAIAFISNPLNKGYVNHKDGNRLNNHVDNLEWVTNQENVLHAMNVLGTMRNKQKENPFAKRVTLRSWDLELTFYTHREAAKFLGVKEVTFHASKRYNRRINGYKIIPHG